MTAPAFMCRCIAEAEGASEDMPWLLAPPGPNHFTLFISEVWEAGVLWREQSQRIVPHYHAHMRGAPHSHIVPDGSGVWRGDGGDCSCHHVEQNYVVDPGEYVRGWGGVE